MSNYRKGAQAERDIVNSLADLPETILVGRFAGSKCKGKLKVDIVHLTDNCLYLYQVKKLKTRYSRGGKEYKRFFSVKVPKTVEVFKQWENYNEKKG